MKATPVLALAAGIIFIAVAGLVVKNKKQRFSDGLTDPQAISLELHSPRTLSNTQEKEAAKKSAFSAPSSQRSNEKQSPSFQSSPAKDQEAETQRTPPPSKFDHCQARSAQELWSRIQDRLGPGELTSRNFLFREKHQPERFLVIGQIRLQKGEVVQHFAERNSLNQPEHSSKNLGRSSSFMDLEEALKNLEPTTLERLRHTQHSPDIVEELFVWGDNLNVVLLRNQRAVSLSFSSAFFSELPSWGRVSCPVGKPCTCETN